MNRDGRRRRRNFAANISSQKISPCRKENYPPVTLGEFTLLLNALLIAGQLCLLKKDFRKEQLLQVPVAILFSFFIDCSMAVLSGVAPSRACARAR